MSMLMAALFQARFRSSAVALPNPWNSSMMPVVMMSQPSPVSISRSALKAVNSAIRAMPDNISAKSMLSFGIFCLAFSIRP